MKLIYLLLISAFFIYGKVKQENNIGWPANKTEVYDIAFEDDDGVCAAVIKTGVKTVVHRRATEPCISKNGREIAYDRLDEQGNRCIYVMNFATRKEVKIKTGRDVNYRPVWSPDNYHLAFLSYRNDSVFVGVVGKDNKGLTMIKRSSDMLNGPVWTTDGKGLVFNSRDSVFICDLSGTCIKKYAIANITKNYLSKDPLLSLTPDGRYLIYVTEIDRPTAKAFTRGDLVLFYTDLQTMEVKRLIRNGAEGWGPYLDGKGNIYFSSYKKKGAAIFRISVADTTLRECMPGVSSFTIRDNVQIAGPVKLKGCDNCPALHEWKAPQLKEETP
jgi:hypothetical protein